MRIKNLNDEPWTSRRPKPTCKACWGRGIVHNSKTGEAQICPLCHGTGIDPKPKDDNLPDHINRTWERRV